MEQLQRAHRACTRCVDAGYIGNAHPVFSCNADQRIILVGQAPGPVEVDVTRPFAGRAGKQLMRWMTRAGFADETDVRNRVYMTSMTTCFPGKLPSGGDRRPSAAEVTLCKPWLDQVMETLQPRLILSIGTLALGRFLPGKRLDDCVGMAFAGGAEHTSRDANRDGPIVLPLPHPSGQSRWLNDPARLAKLELALTELKHWQAWA